MRHVTRFVAKAARLEDVRGATVRAIHEPHDLGGHVAVIVRWTKCVGRCAPSWRKSQEIRQRYPWNSRLRCQDAVNRRIGLVLLYTRHIDELLDGIFVRRVVPVPCYHIERRVRLLTGV